MNIAAKVYRDLGDYGSILPGWLEHPGVLPHVDVEDGHRRGFILLGFYSPDGEDAVFASDLLAIAVAPRYQRQGVGRNLLRYAIEISRLAASGGAVPEMRLTVAETNVAGQRLFQNHGFQVLDQQHGSYDGGQRAIRMHLPLSPPNRAQVST